MLHLLLASGAGAQGQLVFDNRVNNVVVAPVYGLDPAHPAVVQRGNSVNGYPAGTQSYTASPLGAGYTAQLFGGPAYAAHQNLQALRPAAPFRTSVPGFIAPPPTAVRVPGVPEGARAKIQLRAWANRNGAITNWAQVQADPTVPHGESWAFLSPPLGGPSRVPPNLIGLESFNLITGSMAGWALKVRFQPGAATAVAGYVVDSGQLYGPRAGGLTFGWDTDLTSSTYLRDSDDSPDAVHDAFVEIPASGKWTLALSNGLYGVHLSAGDPERTNGLNGVLIQETLLQAEVTPDARWVEADAIVEVRDGRLTMQSSMDSAFNRVCAIEIARLDSVRLEGPAAGRPMATARLFFSGEAGLPYELEATTDFVHWQFRGPAEFLGGERFRFVEEAAAGDSVSFYRARIRTGSAMSNEQ
jgi:hypothetical protein